MKLTGVNAHGVEMATMLATLLQQHGHITAVPEDLDALLAVGRKALTGNEELQRTREVFRGTFGYEGTMLDAEFDVPPNASIVQKDVAFMSALAQQADIHYVCIGSRTTA